MCQHCLNPSALCNLCSLSVPLNLLVQCDRVLVHPLCQLFCLESSLSDVRTKRTFRQITKCSACQQVFQGTVMVQCCIRDCNVFYHPSCAFHLILSGESSRPSLLFLKNADCISGHMLCWQHSFLAASLSPMHSFPPLENIAANYPPGRGGKELFAGRNEPMHGKHISFPSNYPIQFSITTIIYF